MGDRWAYLTQARGEIEAHPAIEPLASSSVLETPPHGFTDQPPFLNQVLKVGTRLSPADLLEELLVLEASLGRRRTMKWGPRNIDIDILMYGGEVVDTPSLVIPHPELLRRPFLVYLLTELEGEITHPVSGKRFAEYMQSWDSRILWKVGRPYGSGS